MKRAFILSCIISWATVAVNAQWTQQITGMTNQSIGTLYADTTTLYAGSITSVFKSTNLGVNWASSSGGLPGVTNFFSIVRSGNFLVAGGDGAGIWRSSNSGGAWVQTTAGVTTNQYTLALAAEGNTVYAAFGFPPAFGLSTDNGATWTKSTTGLSTTSTLTGVAKIGTTLCVLHQTLGAYISTNNGTSWTLMAGAISSQNKNALIATGTSFIAGVSGSSSQNGIFLSTDLGTTWTKVRTGPLVTGLAKNRSTVYAVGDSIHRSTNDGQTWTPVDITGLPGSIFNTIQFAGTFAFVNYFGVGVYRRPISELSAVDEKYSAGIPNNYRLEQNYPNPFNPSTTIQYSIIKSQHVSLKVFDALGREIETLVEGMRESGIHTITWHAYNKPSGVYFYRLQSGRFAETKKLVLLR